MAKICNVGVGLGNFGQVHSGVICDVAAVQYVARIASRECSESRPDVLFLTVRVVNIV